MLKLLQNLQEQKIGGTNYFEYTDEQRGVDKKQ